MQPTVYSGARVTISIGGDQVAAGFVADYNLETGAQPLDTLDSVFPLELMPTRITVSMNLRVYRHPDNDPVISGFAPGSANVGQTEQTAFLSTPYIFIDVKDNFDNTILTIPRAMLIRRSGSVSTGDFLTESWAIQGIGFYGPSDR